MTKTITLLLSFLLVQLLCAQDVPILKPIIGNYLDLSTEKEIAFIKQQERCEEVWHKVNSDADIKKLSTEEQNILANCSETKESTYQIIGAECSWYCGGGPDSISASSYLKNYKGISYAAENIQDLSYKTAWIEGAAGYGLGENVTYHFSHKSPRITKITVVNGYVKSEKSWRENSRVKKLKVYLNDKEFAILNLEDSRAEQSFTFNPIGNNPSLDYSEQELKMGWTLKFEIMEVYKGFKYADTAITEIYFDGIDVH